MTISRRGFIKGAAATTLVAGAAKAGGNKHFKGYADAYGLLHDTTLCVGCRSCEAACKSVNGFPPPKKALSDRSVFDQKRRTDETSHTVVNKYQAEGKEIYRKHQCMHCQEPCCSSVCFVKAFTKTPEGPVLYDPEVCVGCRYCVVACPYDALTYEYNDPLTPKVMRCTMCYPRIKKGLNPGCADACPMGAIVFGKRKDLIKLARERIRKNPGKYIDHVFGEHEWGGISWLTLAGVEFSKLGLPDNIGPTPLADVSTSFLAMAPLVAAIFPGMLAGFYAFSKRKEKLSQEEKEKMIKELTEKADQELKSKLNALEERASKEQEREIKAAVRSALAQAGVEVDQAGDSQADKEGAQ
jgi:Fe-S-cluster-containing dehydrogenase component